MFVAAHLLALAVIAAPKPQTYSIAWRPDGTQIAIGGYKETRLLDVRTHKESPIFATVEAVRALAFSRDGKWLAAAGGLPARKGEVKIWDTGAQTVAQTISGHSDCIYAVAFSPDGATLATASYDKLIKLWDRATAKEIRTLREHIDSVYALAFTPDGKRLVSGAADRSVKVWDVATGTRLYTLSDATDGVNTIAVSPDGSRVAAGGLDKTVRVWRLGDKTGTIENTLIAHEDSILKIAWSPDGKYLATASADRTIKLLRAADLTEVRTFANQPDWVFGLEFAPDGKSFAAGRFDGTLQIYEVHAKVLASGSRPVGLSFFGLADTASPFPEIAHRQPPTRSTLSRRWASRAAPPSK